MKNAKKCFKWIKKNRKWLFSGVGITGISIVMSIIFSKYNTVDESNMQKEDNKIINYGENYGDIYQNVTIYNMNEDDNSSILDDSSEDVEENRLIQVEKDNDEIEYENSIIKDLYLGESREYIESILGIPEFEFPDSELINTFYSLEYTVIRFVFNKNESLVGYFVTSKYKDSKIKIGSPLSNDDIIVFGENTFDPELYPEAVISGLVGMGGMAAINTYYWEYSFMYGVGLYKTYVAAIFPYGFTESESYNLMSIAATESVESQEIFKYREELHPNTIGMMDSNYAETIKPYMPNDENYILWIECMMKLIKDIQ